MVLLNEKTIYRINMLFKLEHSNGAPSIDHLFELLSYFDTYNVNCPVLGRSYAYWEFMHACLDNIISNQWRTLPRMWIEYCNITRELQLTAVQQDAEYRVYLKHRKEVLIKLGLPTDPRHDREVILHWVRNACSEQYMLGISHALARIYMYFAKLHIRGVNNNVSLEPKSNDSSFNSADQAVWPLKGVNKYEVLKNNFKHRYKKHEMMI